MKNSFYGDKTHFRLCLKKVVILRSRASPSLDSRNTSSCLQHSPNSLTVLEHNILIDVSRNKVCSRHLITKCLCFQRLKCETWIWSRCSRIVLDAVRNHTTILRHKLISIHYEARNLMIVLCARCNNPNFALNALPSLL